MSGRDFLRYGGNTTSVELVTDARRSPADRSRHRRDRAREAADGRRVRQGRRASCRSCSRTRTSITSRACRSSRRSSSRATRSGSWVPIRSRACRSRRRCRTSSRRTTARSTASRTSPPASTIETHHARRDARAARLRGRRPPRCRTAACGRPRIRITADGKIVTYPVRRRVSVARRAAAGRRSRSRTMPTS